LLKLHLESVFIPIQLPYHSMLLTQALSLLLLAPPTLAQTAELFYELYSGPPQEICQSFTGIAAASVVIAKQKSASWSVYSTCIPNPGVTCGNNASPSLPTGVTCHLCGFTDTNCQEEAVLERGEYRVASERFH